MSGQIKNVSGVPASLKLEHMFFSKIEYSGKRTFRSQISLVTIQPEFSPIILPPMNIAEMFKEK